SVQVASRGSVGQAKLDCDLLCVSGGWTPTLHLHAQSGGTSRFETDLDAFVPDAAKQQSIAAGSVCGLHRLNDCLDDGRRAAVDVADRLGLSVAEGESWNDVSMAADDRPGILDLQARSGSGGLPKTKGKQFVDLQNDVTAKNIKQAYSENYVSVEHLKRYTTLGMGTDQGKTSNLNGLSMLAQLREEPVPQVGTTTFRPPCTPVTLALLAGRSCGSHLAPTRRTVMHAQHERLAAQFDFNG
ncbi:MAG: sarcosine oxidase subunit alpha, partial [Gammaproteobacteria bacterium]|nr:sarcosine oxidase subunit alpha [Gammaproteobacteria bacterium]